MIHTREEVVERMNREFGLLDRLVANLTDEEWQRPLPRSETKDPWTVKDAVAHITHWKADVVRAMRRQPKPPEERGLNINDGNRFVYLRWRDRPPQEVLAWHRQVQAEVLAALQAAPEAWFSRRAHPPEWHNDLDGHSAYHRLKDIEQALQGGNPRTVG
jgi:hypothetical protein